MTGQDASPVEPRYWLPDEPPDLKMKDAFGVDAFVDRLVAVVQAAHPPFTFSVSGSWGIGKSTVAEALVARLRSANVPAVVINGWTEDIPHLRRTLAIAVGAELRGGAEHRPAVAEQIDSTLRLAHTTTMPPKAELRLLESIKNIRHRPGPFAAAVATIGLILLFAVVSALFAPPLLPAFTTLLGAAFVIAALQSGFFFRIETASDTRAPAEESVEMAEQFRLLVTGGANAPDSDKLQSPPDKVVVVIDNLDRLSGEDALRALAEIRSLVDIRESRCVFMIPVDRRAFAGHIKTALTDDVSAKDYLDKFFNLDLMLTQPEPLDLRNWALDQARVLFPDVAPAEVAGAVQVVASAANGSPRSVVRILNGVSTRFRLMDPAADPRPKLEELALVEGLVTQFPELVSWLDEDPRSLQTLRADLDRSDNVAEQVARVEDVIKKLGQEWPRVLRAEQLRAFLIGNVNVAAPPEVLRIALSLRDDRFWRGVPNAGALRDGLATGEAAAFADAVEALEPDLRPVALDRAVEAIVRSGTTFARDAVSGILAVSPLIGDYPAAAARLHPIAVAVLVATDGANRQRLSQPAAVFLLDRSRTYPKRGQLVALMADALVGAAQSLTSGASTAPGADVNGLVRAACLGAGSIGTEWLSQVCSALSTLNDDYQALLFEEPVAVRLVEGPVAAALIARITAVDDLARDGLDREVIAAQRLLVFVEAGGSDPGLTQIADRLAALVSAGTDDLGNSAVALLRSSVLALKDAPGASTDTFAGALETRTATIRSTFLDLALTLPTADARRQNTVSLIDAWLSSPAATYDQVEVLLPLHRATLAKFGGGYASRLADKWIDTADIRFAVLLVDLDGEAGMTRVRQQLTAPSVPPAQFGRRAAEAAKVIKPASGELPALVADLASWVQATAAPADIATVAEALKDLDTLDIDVTPIAGALESRLRGASAADLPALNAAVRQLGADSVRAVAPLATVMAARTAAVAAVDPASCGWLARRTSGSNDAATCLVQVILSSTIPLPALTPVLDECVRPLKRSGRIRAAIVERAANASTSEDDARVLLENAKNWAPPRVALDAYRDNLTAVARFDSLTQLVNDLRTA